MPSRILLEDSYRFKTDRAALTESLKSGGNRKLPMDIPGVISECGVKNGNGRRYRRNVWEKQLAPGSRLSQLMAENSAFGKLEHPKDGLVDLESPFSHLLINARLVEGATPDKPQVVGTVRLLDTPEGNRMLAYMEAGYDPLFSTRGFGSLETVTESEGQVDDVQEDYVCEGGDFVFKPSFTNARFKGEAARETPIPAAGASDPKELFAQMNRAVGEGRLKAESVRLDGQVVIVESTTRQEPSLPPKQVDHSKESTTMEKLTPIRESLNSLRQTDLTKIDPDMLSRGLNQMEALHEQAATVQVEDPKAGWQVTRLHNDISVVEAQWKTAAAAPSAKVVKLGEDNQKLVRVLHATAETALKIKRGLGEALKQGAKTKTNLTEAIRRGQGWMGRAQTAEAKLKTAEGRLDLCYESLDEFTTRYNKDCTTLGRRLIELEFKPTDESVLKQLKEATHPSQLIKLRESLEAPKGAAKPVVESTPAGAAKSAAVPEGTKTVTIATPLGSAQPVVETTLRSYERPFSISESSAMAARLSTATTAAK